MYAIFLVVSKVVMSSSTRGHDLQESYQVEQLVKRQKAEYEKRDKEKGQNVAGGKGRGGEVNRPGNPFRNQGNPARGREKETCDDESDGGDEEETMSRSFRRPLTPYA